MKETKMYVDELPKSCVGCKYFAEHRRQCNLELCFQWSEEKQKYNDCPLKSLHDRELVKEVCEKIKNNVNDMPYYDDRTGYVSPTDVCEMIDELQKEFEK